MSGVKVTIYDDDEFGRDIHVVKINTRLGKAHEHHIVKSSDERGSSPLMIEVGEDEILLVTRAD